MPSQRFTLDINEIDEELRVPVEFIDPETGATRPFTPEEWQAERERRCGKSTFRCMIVHGDKHLVIEGPMAAEVDRDNAMRSLLKMVAEALDFRLNPIVKGK